MNKNKPGILALLICISMLLTSCQGQVPTSDTDPATTLPPAVQKYVAPIGDAALEYTASATLYLPRLSGFLLEAIETEAAFSAARPDAESLVRALLNQPSNKSVSAVGGNVKLSLYGVNPVEVSRNVATVNLSASALQMDRKSYFLSCQAITNTLTELPEIDYVNFLVVDRAVGLDIANTLPMGSLSRNTESDIGAAYEQMLLRRVDVTETAAEKSLTSTVTLYFPHAKAPGILSEVRSCTFRNQLIPDMIVTLLHELAAGSQQGIDTPALPLLADMLSEAPKVVESEENGKLIELNFAYNLDEMLLGNHLSRSSCMASICYTLCTFFPGISGIRVTIGEQPVETLMLTDHFESSVVFPNQVQQRKDFASLLYDECTLVLPDENGEKLVELKRPVPYYQADNPRTELLELAKGPLAQDSLTSVMAIMPKEGIVDADIIGLALDDGTLLVNFSAAFANESQEYDLHQEQLLAYALVNTLCQHPQVQLVHFFLSGKPFEGFSGEIFWESDFAPMY
ncbi:MAG: hypothetical protein E7319_06150 [Clostridiales bacterium]|nr:hypothetical protein [Clostridiales bacterium]